MEWRKEERERERERKNPKFTGENANYKSWSNQSCYNDWGALVSLPTKRQFILIEFRTISFYSVSVEGILFSEINRRPFKI